MSMDPDEELLDYSPPSIDITQTGRWTYSLKMNDGLMCWDDWPLPVHGSRKRAERKARRILAKYTKPRGETIRIEAAN
jgi:hypothetical protein